MPNVAMYLDTTTHGGSIVVPSPVATRFFCEGGRPVATVLGTVICPFHGYTVILTGSGTVLAGGLPVAVSGSITSCGALVIGTAARTFAPLTIPLGAFTVGTNVLSPAASPGVPALASGGVLV
jgi:uncharacterized Zn-binding protein involved in type VI secretion